MTVTDGVSLLVGLLAAVVGLVGVRAQRRLALDAALRKQQADLAAKQEAVTAEQIKADDAEAQRLSEGIWELVRQLRTSCADQEQRIVALEDRLGEKDRRIEALEGKVRELSADLEQVRHIERVARNKVERLTAENTTLTGEVERLKAENAALHARVDELEKRQNGSAPAAPAVT